MITFSALLAIIAFVTGYLFIALEHKFNLHKSGIALALAGVLWIIVALSGTSQAVLHEQLVEAGGEIFAIIIFLLTSMTLVEILVHYRFFDVVRAKLFKLHLSDRGQFVLIMALTLLMSAGLDNITVTIVMIQIARRFFKDTNLLLAVSGIVIMSNAGGAWSPIGDITTLILWLAQKFTAVEVIKWAVGPATVLALVSGGLMLRSITTSTKDKKEEKVAPLTLGEKLVTFLTICSFILPLLINPLGLDPYLGRLLGLGVVWLVINYLRVRSTHTTHLTADIEKLIQKTDIASLKFFVGILLSVAALKAAGVLDFISVLIFGETQEVGRVIFGTTIIGALSSIVDNVPLTALSLDLIKLTDPAIWSLLAITVGTGGSFLIIGSVSGVIAMGMVKELTFAKYLRLAFIPAVAGYLASIVVWLVEYYVLKF